MSNDLLEAVDAFVCAFKRENIDPPLEIVLSDRALWEFKSNVLSSIGAIYVGPNDLEYNCIKLMGIKFKSASEPIKL